MRLLAKVFLAICSCVLFGSCAANRTVIYTPESWPQEIRGSVFEPKGSESGPAPAVLLLHGGVKLGEDGRWIMNRTAQKLADRGYYVLNITYRSVVKWPYPAQLMDVQEALNWMRRNAKREGIDPDRIGVFGYSAGGYLGTLAALDRRNGDPEVKAIIAGGTPTDLTVYERGILVRTYLGGGAIPRPEQIAEASPLAYVDKECPPIFIYHGTSDKLVRPEHALDLAAALRFHHIPHQVFWIRGKGHVGTFFSSRKAVEAAISFLDEYLK